MPPITSSHKKSTPYDHSAHSPVQDEGARSSSNHSVLKKRILVRRTDLPIRGPVSALRYMTPSGLAVFVLTELYLLILGVFHVHHRMRWDRFSLIAVIVHVAVALPMMMESMPSRQNAGGQKLSFLVSMVLCAALFFTFYLMPESRSLLIPFLFLVVAYGMHRIRQGNMILLSLIIWLGYGVVTGIPRILHTNSTHLWGGLLDWTALAISLSGFVLLTGRINRLHMALHKADLKLRHIEEHARRDPFLECYNRHYIVAALEDQKRRAEEQETPLCLAMIDLDHFKRINDEVGHLAGDEVLLTFSRLTQQTIRHGDIFGRYGGEEFILILPSTSLQAALALTERIRESIQNYCWKGKLHRNVTVSIGLAQYLKGESVLDFFSRTDAAMYLAKRNGRNKVVIGETRFE